MNRRVFFTVLFLFVSFVFALPSSVFADEGGISYTAGGSGGGCEESGGGSSVFTSSTDDFLASDTVQSCVGVVSVYYNAGAIGDGQCLYVPVGDYDCDTGDWHVYGSATERSADVTAACEFNSPFHNCEINVWTGQLECAFWDWLLHAGVNFPCATLDIEPYPVTMVRWPTYLRFTGAGTSGASAYLPYRGRGTPDHPAPGDQKDITLTVALKPYMNYMQVHLPRAGYYRGEGEHCVEAGVFTLPLQNPMSRPRTVICWNVPSHPAAGAGPLAGGVAGMDELAADFPLFVGWARVPYYAEWRLTYDQWDVVDRYCEAGPAGQDDEGNPIYECKTEGAFVDNGHWEDIYDWRRHGAGGMIDPAVVQGIPAALKADLNGDGRPDAFWNYNVRIRRMNESWSVHDPVYRREWPCRPEVYFAVREGQTQSIYLHP